MSMENNDELFISTEAFDQMVSIDFDSSVGFLMTLHNLLNLGLDMEAFESDDTESLTNLHEAIIEKLAQFATAETGDI